MKLSHVGNRGFETPAALDNDGVLRDLSAYVDDVAGDGLSDASLVRLASIDLSQLPFVEGTMRIGPCVGRVGKFICVGFNYADHAAESGMRAPPEPVLLMKATTEISGPYDDVLMPRGSSKCHWEVEPGAAIGSEVKCVKGSKAMSHVAGCSVANDVSERAFQLERGRQWVMGKSADTVAPRGPWLVTCDKVADPQALAICLEVDGHRHRNGSTRTMFYGVAFLVSYISQFMTLRPGDVISTSTPSGVGLEQKPPICLKADRTMRLGNPGLGEQQLVVGQA